MGIKVSRNVFDKSPAIPPEDFEFLKDKLHVLLPPPTDGSHYELVTLPSGNQAVVLVKP